MKKIAIIGGGISGLSVLHYLKQRLGDTVEITLYEREAVTGGTIRSFKDNSCLFEWGPNGFLDNQPATLELIEELGLTDQLIEASPNAKRRYIQRNNKLIPLPAGPIDFICSPLLPAKDKWALIKGVFKKNISSDQSIYNYVSQRFSQGIAENLVDPFISGIYAGDIKRLHMASAFPKLKYKGFRKTRMRSFKNGMGQIIETLEKRYRNNIQTNSEISTNITADINIIATPAYCAAQITENINPELAKLLDQIHYAPVTVAGLIFNKKTFKIQPDGFGYLVPSKENKTILGVLIESNVYENRAGEETMMMRVMMGGSHHPAIINDDENEIIKKAVKEIDSIYGLAAAPLQTFVKRWPKAIPQYHNKYPRWKQSIIQLCRKTPGLFLHANYLNGISFNDCVSHSKNLAARLIV